MSEDIRNWTIMVYMAGNNNLSENMAIALNELSSFKTVRNVMGAATFEEAKVSLLAFFDGNSITAPTQYVDFTEFVNGKPFTKELYNVNSASGDSIFDFVNWCLVERGRSSENYALIFSGHSDAFRNTTLMIDDASKANLSLPNFRATMERINKELLNNNKIGIIGFDSCLMSTLEVGYELKDVANVLVASEGSLPTTGWGYTAILKELFPNITDKGWLATDDQKEVASNFVEACVSHYKKLAIGGRSVDFSAWDLDEIEPLAKSLNELAESFNTYLNISTKVADKTLTDKDIEIYQELRKIILQSHFDAQTYMSNQNIDLADFCNRLIIELSFLIGKGRDYEVEIKQIIGQCKAVIKDISNCVISCGYVGEDFQFSNGIAIYFPWTLLAYSITNSNYEDLKFVSFDRYTGQYNGIGKEWDKFLFNYLSKVTFRFCRKNEAGQVRYSEKFNSTDNPFWRLDSKIWTKDYRFPNQKANIHLSNGISSAYVTQLTPAKIQELNKNNSELNKNNSELNKNNSELNKNNSELNKRNSELDKNNSELNKNNSELDKRNSELDKNNSELDKRNSEIDKNSAEFAQNTAEINKNNSEINRNNSEINKNNSELDKNNSELSKNNSEINKNNSEINKNNSEINKNNSEINKNNSELNKNNSEYNKNNSELNKNNSELDKGQSGQMNSYFSRMKNTEYSYKISGYSNETEPES